MRHFATREELNELKDWMLFNFTTKTEFKQEFTRLEHRLDAFQDDATTKFDKIFGMLEMLNQERIFTHHHLEKFDLKFEAQDVRFDILEQQNKTFSERFDQHDARFDQQDAKLKEHDHEFQRMNSKLDILTDLVLEIRQKLGG